MRKWIFPLLLAAAAAAQEQAQEAKKAQVPRPPPELEQLKPFIWSANCTGQDEESPFGPAHKTVGTAGGRKDPSGFWVLIHYQEKKTRENPAAVGADERWGYDPGAKKFVALVSDSMGGYGMATSPGWEGDDLVWTGDMYMNGQKTGYRQTFTRAKDGSISEMFEMQMDGQWKKLSSGSCKKAK
jgi:hypothetical protein